MQNKIEVEIDCELFDLLIKTYQKDLERKKKRHVKELNNILKSILK